MERANRRVTSLLGQVSRGDRAALSLLLETVYSELRRRAEGVMRGERRGHTLQPTALVHEAYLRLVDASIADVKDRNHFFAIAAAMMRRVLVDHARARGARKRQGGGVRVPLEDGLLPGRSDIDLLEIDEALGRLARHDERLAKVVELRFFGGLDVEAVAGVLGVDARTVKRDWRAARVLLLDALGEAAPQAATRG